MDDIAIRYFVNDDPQETSEQKLTVREILKNAGFTPVKDYDLTKGTDSKPFPSLDEEISIQKDDKFIAVFNGTTPVS